MPNISKITTPDGNEYDVKDLKARGIELTQAEYDALPSSKLTDDVNYFIKDANIPITLDLIYPVGSIFMSVNNVNPGTYLPNTTWVAWGSGRVPVGVDTSQTEFDTVEETGGAKSVTLTAAQSGVPSHGHTYTRPTVSSSGKVTNGITGGSHTHQVDRSNAGAGMTTWGLVGNGAHGGAVLLIQNQSGSHYNVQSTTHTHDLPNHTHTLTGGGVANNTAANASQAHTNLQPYITCYMWKRTA